MANGARRIDMINGPLTKNIIIFTVPLILSALLQLLYNAADMIVLGRFSPVSDGIAAVGATSSMTSLLVNMFLGLAVGANVVASRYYGQRNEKGMERITHTAISVSFIGGVVIAAVCFVLSRPLLTLTGTPDDIIDLSVLYMRIYCLGLPAQMVYNFGAAILRSIGETKKPLYILMVSGLINVMLNLFFVIVLRMSVDGVALATISSHLISATAVIICLSRIKDSCRFSPKKLCIRKTELFSTVRYGLPAGIQTSFFSLANTIIQANVNSHGTSAMNGNATSGNLESFLYSMMFQFSVAALTFISQNIGAGRQDRIPKVTRTCSLLVLGVGLAGAAVYAIFGKTLCGIYLPDDPLGVELGYTRLMIISSIYFVLGIQDTVVGSLRGMGYSLASMLISLVGICASRIIWTYSVYLIFDKSIVVLWLSYPVSWILTLGAQLILYRKVLKKTLAEAAGRQALIRS